MSKYTVYTCTVSDDTSKSKVYNRNSISICGNNLSNCTITTNRGTSTITVIRTHYSSDSESSDSESSGSSISDVGTPSDE